MPDAAQGAHLYITKQMLASLHASCILTTFSLILTYRFFHDLIQKTNPGIKINPGLIRAFDKWQACLVKQTNLLPIFFLANEDKKFRAIFRTKF